MSLTLRIVLIFCLVAGVGLYAFITTALSRVQRQYMEAVEEPMVDAANIFAELIARSARVDQPLDTADFAAAWQAAQERVIQAKIYSRSKSRVDMQAYCTDEVGRILFDTSGREAVGRPSGFRDVVLTLHGHYGARASRMDPDDPRSMTLFVAAPIVIGGKIRGVVSIAKPLNSLVAFINETERWLNVVGLTIIALMLAGLAWAARWVTRPLDLLTRHALAVSQGQRPVPPRMPGHHLKTLGRAFEDMREALEGREYVESYVQSLTHELKSPVAAIMGAAEILDGEVPEPRRRRFLQNIRSEAARLHDLIDRMLQLTGLEKQKALASPEPVDVRQLVERSWDHLEASAAARRIAWELEGTPGTVISGDPWLMELAIGNLLQNAIEFSPAGGRIRATIEPGAGDLRLHIDDEGPGIPDYATGRIFERFYSLPRPETGKKSSGLGLCFVREIVHLHRGGIVLRNRKEGGVRATLTLPV